MAAQSSTHSSRSSINTHTHAVGESVYSSLTLQGQSADHGLVQSEYRSVLNFLLCVSCSLTYFLLNIFRFMQHVFSANRNRIFLVFLFYSSTSETVQNYMKYKYE